MSFFRTSTFDKILACLLPLALLLLCYRLCSPFAWSEIFALLWPRNRTPVPSYFSLERAYASYMRYSTLSGEELWNMRKSLGTLRGGDKQRAARIRYPEKLDKLQLLIAHNADVTDQIAKLASQQFDLPPQPREADANSADLGRVREAMKHFVRDWSSEGVRERERIFEPILNALRGPRERFKDSVLVPGCGLGRLAWEISQLGFNTTANELSFFMTLAFRFLLSPETTSNVDQHKLYPYAHWFSHQRNNDNLFRSVHFPDAIPRLGRKFSLVEQDFLLLKKPAAPAFYLKENPALERGYDYIVTLFFIDTSVNVFATIAHIYYLLKPGGKWINLGPLLWPGGGIAKIELSLEEVLLAAKDIGFVFPDESDPVEGRKTIPCEYTGDRRAMMSWIYRAEFWVARKPESG
ncbi:N2227-like protein-domain-containing protein [Cyathus striatus]|nr:N2227-like protein-domain-containing protein [Cyathus striatus]